LRVVRFSLLKNTFLPLISFRGRSNFECICCITDVIKTVSSYGWLQKLHVTATAIELSEVDGIANVEPPNNYSSGLRFQAPEGGRCWGNVWEDSLKEHGLLLV
jgi:hypothetical protein